MADAALHHQDGIVGNQRQRAQRRLFTDKGLVYDPAGGGVVTRIGNLSAPAFKLRVQILYVAECPGQKEVLPDIAEGSFHLAFGFAAI